MSRALEIYPLRRQLETELKNIRKDPFNSAVILRYYNARVAEGIGVPRIYKCINTLKLISKMLNMHFEDATKDDIVRMIAELEQKDFSDWTKHDYKVVLKHFYKWLRNYEEGSPPEVRWIKNVRNVENRYPILPKDLLRPEEKAAMIRATQNPRDRALLEVFAESGRRLGELLTLHVGDVEFDDMGAKLFMRGKVGEDFSRIISSAPALAIWLDNHPLRENPNAPVWIGIGHENRNRQITHAAATNILKRLARRAGIKRRVHFYLFRHTRVDETQGILTEAQQCMMFGWRFGSRMPAVYMKRYAKHIDDAQAIMNGVTPSKREILVVDSPKKCSRCTMNNPSTSKFCNRCGSALDIKTALQVDQSRKVVETLLEKLTNDPEKIEKLFELVRDRP